MDEATWAILLCKDSSSNDPSNTVNDYCDDKHNNLETIQQHITDISNSFSAVEDGGGHYSSSNSSNSNYSNNNNNSNNVHNFNNTLTKEYKRIGSNGLPLRGNCSPTEEGGNEFIDLGNEYHHLEMIHFNSNNNHHHHDHGRQNYHPPHHNSTNNNMMTCAMQPQEQVPHHHYTNGDHNHYQLQNHHLEHRLNYHDAGSSTVHNYNNVPDTSLSNSSPVSLNPAQNNPNHRYHTNAYALRRQINHGLIMRETTNNYHPYTTNHTSTTHDNTDQESCSDTDIKPVVIKEEPPNCPPRRKPGRPRGSRRKKPEKLGRLWEFIRDLLLNPESCPSLICWDNYDEGTFRFVRSDKVAKLWGEKRDNPEMNYEKLSRAMRYYYKSKVLQPVFGRRLVYKFGPEARGWKTPNPNFTSSC